MLNSSTHVSDLVHRARQSVVGSVRHTAAVPPEVPLHRRCSARRTPLPACPRRHAVLAGLPHAVWDRLPETKRKPRCYHTTQYSMLQFHCTATVTVTTTEKPSPLLTTTLVDSTELGSLKIHSFTLAFSVK